VRGTAAPDSDIDLVVVAPEFDPPRNEDLVDLLWESRGEADWRIEPFACGERQWETDDGNPLLEIVRREGKTIV
jgi:predicted nucleotidyltransferase